MSKEEYIFVLGDSRTGTSSLGSYLSALGFPSKHYYVNEADQISPDHENRKKNWFKLTQYINSSGFRSFSDYPTRLYYKQLSVRYPNSYFILSVRSSTERWLKSMSTYFTKFNISLNSAEIVRNYEGINKEIEAYFAEREYKFLKISIDDDDQVLSEKIKGFIGADSTAVLGCENTSEDIDVEDVSRRKVLYKNSKSNDWLEYIHRVNSPYKTLLSERGWIYLINDSNSFYDWCHGRKFWSEAQRAHVNNLLRNRVSKIKEKGASYFKFITPEKNVVYPEFLPHIFEEKGFYEERPAKLMAVDNDSVFYLDQYLKSAKGFNQIYFRGDSHVNWFGAYYIYRYIMMKLSQSGLKLGKVLSLSDLNASLANYKGDLYSQMSPSQKVDTHSVWGPFNLSESLGYEVKLDLHSKSFRTVDVPERYRKYAETREVIITENDNADLPVAVVYRDSTCDFLIDFLSTHFKRVVFIWHKGNVYSDVIEVENPDVVLNFMAERFVSNYYERSILN